MPAPPCGFPNARAAYICHSPSIDSRAGTLIAPRKGEKGSAVTFFFCLPAPTATHFRGGEENYNSFTSHLVALPGVRVRAGTCGERLPLGQCRCPNPIGPGLENLPTEKPLRPNAPVTCSSCVTSNPLDVLARPCLVLMLLLLLLADLTLKKTDGLAGSGHQGATAIECRR
ncbi:XRE family transcriptional regulator [Anopheles sinensis]|uniref:XRE family transcriptional regulator n=1 Tax=Anopheles sinensis TaxID=74873 RepID=A0A084VXE8_ANOSI|nr:XRE family transcriptional regulator [Anopheles sinensis]